LRECQPLRPFGKPGDLELVALKLPAHQRVKGERRTLRGVPRAVVKHRATHVDQQDGGNRPAGFPLIHLEILGGKRNAGTRSTTKYANHDRAREIQREGIAELPWRAPLRLTAHTTALPPLVLAATRSLDMRKDRTEHLLTDPSHRPRRQVQPITCL